MVSGKFFGEIALLEHKKREANVIAETCCEIGVITKDDFYRSRSRTEGRAEKGRERHAGNASTVATKLTPEQFSMTTQCTSPSL